MHEENGTYREKVKDDWNKVDTVPSHYHVRYDLLETSKFILIAGTKSIAYRKDCKQDAEPPHLNDHLAFVILLNVMDEDGEGYD